jgi:WD40 repeat protein
VVRLHSVNTPVAESVILPGHEGSVNTLAFSSDGRWLATGSSNENTRLWDMSNFAAQPIILRGHDYAIYTLAFSPDGHWLVTGGQDSTARLWNMDNISSEPIILRGPEALVLTLGFSPDGKQLAIGSGDGTVSLWSMDINHLIATACKVVGRNFSQAEWAQYFPNEEYRKTCEQWPLESEVISTP